MADKLLKAIIRGDGRKVAELLHGMPEAERRERAPALLELARGLGDEDAVVTRNGLRPVREWDPRGIRANRQQEVLQLALLGTATLSELRRQDEWQRSLMDDALAAEVLLDRRPSWLASWAAWILTAETWWSKWPVVRTLIRAGALERPPDDAYLNGWLNAGVKAPALLESDPELLERDVWALLAFNRGEASLRSSDDQLKSGWREAIRGCVADGRMDRDRVLDAALDALAADINGYRAAWYTGLWKALEVTREERAARAAALRTLLGAAAAPIVSFAVDELLKARADVPPTELTAALSAPAKKTVRGALKLLDPSEDAELAMIALGHEAADIQGEVLDRLERWGAPRELLLRYLDGLAATQRPRAEALLGLTLPEAATDVPDVDVDAIPEAIRAALGFGGPVPPAPVAGEPVLGEPITPMDSLGELADALLTELTLTGPARDERLLDGILRHCDQPFDGPLDPLAPKLGGQIQSFWAAMPATVATAWMRQTPPTLSSIADVWERRIHAAAQRAARGEARPLLALPTHVGGWIEPAALVARMHPDPDELDLAQALLRLAPGGHADAARGIPGRPGDLLRCALGGDPVPDDGPAAAAALAVSGRMEVRIEVDDERNATRTPSGELGTGPLAEHLDAAAPTGRVATSHWPQDPFVWPARRDIACAVAIRGIAFNVSSTSGYEVATPVLEVLLAAHEPLPPLALRLIGLALGSSHDREHLLATDVVIAGTDDGRIDAGALIAGLRQDLPIIKPNRLAARLETVAAAGPLHRAVVRDALDGVVAAKHTPLLVLFDELCAQTNTGPKHAREHLATITGSSKAAKAARSLLARTGDPPPAEAQLALAARVRRAQRWIG